MVGVGEEGRVGIRIEGVFEFILEKSWVEESGKRINRVVSRLGFGINFVFY